MLVARARGAHAARGSVYCHRRRAALARAALFSARGAKLLRMRSLAEAPVLHARDMGTLTHTRGPTGIIHSRPSTPEASVDIEIKDQQIFSENF